MSFNPHTTKQAQEVILSQKSKKANHPKIYFNDSMVSHTNCQKHLEMHLDKKLNFLQYIKEKTSKANRSIGVIRKLRHILPRHSLITIFKSFRRLHLDYCDIVYDQPNMKASTTKLNGFNTILLLQLRLLSEGDPKLNGTKNMALNHLNSGDE